MATESNIFVPEKAVWEQAKSLARCACNEPSKLECTNFELPSTTIDGNEACTCRCHKHPMKGPTP